MIRIVRGEPTDEELAALVAALLARRPVPPRPAATGPSAWTRSGRAGRVSSGYSPRVWRTALPR